MILGLDLGTTNVAGVLLRPGERKAALTASRSHGADVAGLPADHHEQCPGKILEACFELIRFLVSEAEQPVTGIALTGQMHGILAVDEGLNPLTNLVTWRDRRTEGRGAEVGHHQYAEETGCFLHPGYGALTLHDWLQKRSLPPGTRAVLSIPGLLAARLTGNCAVDESFAASWGVWNLRQKAWHEPLLKELGISEDLLPPYAPSCCELGPVRDAEAFGLPPGAVVHCPVGDNQAGVVGVLVSGESEAVVNVGTSGQLSLPLDEPEYSARGETRPRPGGGFLQVFAVLCGGWSYSYLASFFRQVIRQVGNTEISLLEVMDRMQDFCRTTDAGGLVVDPRFAGERLGQASRGSIGEIDTKNLTPGNLTRGFINAMAAELAEASADADFSRYNGLVAVGNGVRKNPLLLRALAERFGMPCRLAEAAEEAALGAARCVQERQDRRPKTEDRRLKTED